MKKILSKIIGTGIIASLLIIPILSVKAETAKNKLSTSTIEKRIENREVRIENRIERASTTEKRLENRENNMDRIRARLASTTASTSAKKIEKLNDRLAKQTEQMGKIKERLQEKELKITDVLGQISSKIQERINILVTKGLDMTAAKAKLAEATTKIEDMTVEINSLVALIETEITDTNQAQLFTDIRASQDKIKTMAREAHALLVDTIKEITKVLPQKNKATTTATSTNN